jgi:hypothetical protein
MGARKHRALHWRMKRDANSRWQLLGRHRRCGVNQNISVTSDEVFGFAEQLRLREIFHARVRITAFSRHLAGPRPRDRGHG